MQVCMNTPVCAHVYVCIFVCLYMHMYIYVFCVCVYVCMCMHVYNNYMKKNFGKYRLNRDHLHSSFKGQNYG